METNIGKTDQAVRVILAAITGLTSIGILANYVNQPEIYSPLLGIISIVLLATGLTGKCGLYERFGINRSQVKQEA
ncbi:MAG: DUF2892 domain-containing protein [Candidatus Nanohaloarchaea archaeon]